MWGCARHKEARGSFAKLNKLVETRGVEPLTSTMPS